jgi:hypothetical protein
VATLFSSSFWNFDPRSTGPIVSVWVWLYFAVTVALTLIVLGCWRGYTLFKEAVKFSRGGWRRDSLPMQVGRKTPLIDEEAAKKGI